MSLSVINLPETDDPEVLPHYRGAKMKIEIEGEEDIKLFQQLVNRAMNCWDRAPAKLKAFGDIVTEGKVLQNYTDLGSEVKID